MLSEVVWIKDEFMAKENILHIQDGDIVDGTPLPDIKPYVPEFDIREAEKTEWLEKNVPKLSSSKDDGVITKRRM
jgi:tRNA (Thr-GGU) A37 N-methylase